MNYSNKHNLPPAVFKALTQDNYSAGDSDYSCTTVLKAPRMVQLERRHNDEIVVDAMDQLWSLLGTAVHNIFEVNVEEGAVAEVRMYIESCGRKIGGMLDHYVDGQITDYKCTSIWTWIFGDRIKEWTEQQNIYAEIYRQNGFTVNALRIMVVFRDWKENEFKKNPKQYPPLPFMIINLEVWPDGTAMPFIDGRVQMQIAAETLADDDLPLCTDQEMWAKPDKYAVWKNELKKASRVLLTKEDAENWIEEHKAKDKKEQKYRIEFRPGVRTRCERFCKAAPFCNQHQAFLKAKEKTDDQASD